MIRKYFKIKKSKLLRKTYMLFNISVVDHISREEYERLRKILEET